MGDIPALIKEYIKSYPNGQVLMDEPMSRHTSFHIGGRVKAMFLPGSESEISEIMGLVSNYGVRSLVIGNGTNLLVNDRDLDMIVIKTSEKMNSACLAVEDIFTVKAECGITLSRLAVFAMNNGLAGLEFAHGIPGTLGGAVCMNAGAYGGEMRDVISSVTVLENGAVKTYDNAECGFDYRKSRFSDNDVVVLSAELKLKEGRRNDIKDRMEELAAKRRASQPLNMPSAGSTFKRPANGYAAALIDEAGLKGKGFGGAQVSEKHAGFVVNTGEATFDDVIKTMDMIVDTVNAKTGIMLYPEVKIIR
jgi:UDP-N-acetylmuramate dehydrogenase